MNFDFATSLHNFAQWRNNVARQITTYQRWLEAEALTDPQAEARLSELCATLQDDKLVVAFVAEFSRGKSELINAIFFGDYGRRVLPSASGRTTMCPTELLWDSELPPGIQLLPIDTRSSRHPLSEFITLPDEWTIVPFDVRSGASVSAAMQALRQTRQVPAAEARRLGLLYQRDTGEAGEDGDPDRLVLIPAWRHAIVNFPHPLLQQGLVVLDTPGFNVIGAEPELTLELLPSAHAIVYVLALDTGVTKSDLEVWREAVSLSEPGDQLRYAVLNKIDTIWDGLRTDEEIEAEILQQRMQCGEALDIDAERIFPVSAQKGLIAKITGDEALLDRSRLPLLEQAISANLLPQRRQVLRDSAIQQIAQLMGRTRTLLESRQSSVREQLAELLALHGRNADVAAHMMRGALVEKQSFEGGLVRFQQLRREFSGFSNELLIQLGVDALAHETRRMIDDAMASQFKFTSNLRGVMQAYLDDCQDRMDRATELLDDLQKVLAELYLKFEQEHGLRLGAPLPLALLRHQRELARLEEIFEQKFKSLRALLATDDRGLLHRFIRTIVARVYEVFSAANSGIDTWLRSVMAPVEIQIREKEQQIRRRLESIKQIRNAASTIDARIAELRETDTQLTGKIGEINRMAEELGKFLDSGPPRMTAAAA
jgi:hypothetical protein